MNPIVCSRGGRSRLADVGGHHEPDFAGRFRILVDERRQPQRHARHAERRAQRFDERLVGRLAARLSDRARMPAAIAGSRLLRCTDTSMR